MPISYLKLPAPAKINHFLHVCGRRPDGYHNLQTVFQFLDIADELSFDLREDGVINLTTRFAGVAEQDNLIVKAAKALQKIAGCCWGVDIGITKNLPMGAGIGGGSSDAATTLVALNCLWDLGFSTAKLQSIGVVLGADVPVFIHGHSAWAEGIGEELSNLDLEESWYLLLFPACHVSTATIFSHSDLTRDSKMTKIAAFLEQGNSSSFRNDCENLVRKLYPEVDDALNALSAYGKARMTGTGACVFSAFATQEEALVVSKKLSPRFQSVISKGINESPLYASLKTVS